MNQPEGKPDDLVARAVTGDTIALERLLLDHHDRLLRRIDRGLPLDVERAHSAEDVLQDVFADAFRHIDRLQVQSRAGFARWIDTIARNRLINLIKEERALKRGGGVAILDGTAADAVLALLSRDTASPGQKLLTGEQITTLKSAFEMLPEDYRTVLKLRFVDALDYQEIAAQMNRPAGASRMLALRALRHLRSLLSSDSA